MCVVSYRLVNAAQEINTCSSIAYYKERETLLPQLQFGTKRRHIQSVSSIIHLIIMIMFHTFIGACTYVTGLKLRTEPNFIVQHAACIDTDYDI